MLLNEKLIAKLQPHVERIINGDANDFDYLPATLSCTILGQRQIQEQQEKIIDVLREFYVASQKQYSRTMGLLIVIALLAAIAAGASLFVLLR